LKPARAVVGLFVPSFVLLMAAACSGPSGPQPAELQAIDRPLPVRQLWSASVGSGQRFTFSPVHVGEAVYAASRDGTVTRLAARTGDTRWQASLDLPLSGGVGADGKLVVVASEEGEVVALDAETGGVKWRARASSEVLAAPALGGGLVLVRSIDNRVFAFGADDGKRRWVYQRAPTSLLVRAPAGIAIQDELAYAGFPGGKLAALSLANGALRWEANVALPKGTTELERVADVIGEPAVQGREVCAAAYRSRVGCFDALSGRQIWARELVVMSGVTLDAGQAYVSDERGAVHALDRANGQSVWKQDALAYRGLTTPLPRGEVVAVGDFEGYVHFLARESGRFLARKETDGGALRAGPVPLVGSLLVQTEGGGVYAFGP
jgi:outer membrane protein assembly factor BamB